MTPPKLPTYLCAAQQTVLCTFTSDSLSLNRLNKLSALHLLCCYSTPCQQTTKLFLYDTQKRLPPPPPAAKSVKMSAPPPPPQSDAFKQAVVDSKKLTSKPSNEDLLEIYSFYKVATGENFDKAPAPGMFDLKGKAKYNAWKKVVQEDALSAEQAQEKYVAKIKEMKGKYGYDANKEPEAVGGGN
ncbi:acyl CoA binding protein-domain-containing protein [Diplogelasinospora grovesii]|uniref:Acyl CoA binding protein-domain-containing protein n=1 Tax=Diplogelasinospora grovesii TaxID=303347 RepID=A0AAN6N7F2_9PEZI|nr:acyl CoA binding protein-domain-containing protein [Diplogelasinospora grovesii]